jgi:hypothetical protein
MKALFLVLCAASTLYAAPIRQQVSRDGWITNTIEEVATPQEVVRTLSDYHPQAQTRGGGEEIVIIDQIINLGQKIWAIIEKNHPVVNINYQYANALPAGVKSSSELEGFSDLVFRSYRMYGKNLFGVTVYDVTYTLVHRYGGSYLGKGRYLENVTVLPHNVEVAWGYKVSLDVNNVSVLNVGTKDKPVGAVTMGLEFNVHTAVKSADFKSVFGFRGDSANVQTIE